MVMKRGSIQPYGASAWQSKAAHEKLGFDSPNQPKTAPKPDFDQLKKKSDFFEKSPKIAGRRHRPEAL